MSNSVRSIHSSRTIRATTFATAASAIALLAPALAAQQRAWTNFGGHTADALGASLTYVPDVDGDGVVDLLVGAPGSESFLVGKARLYSGATRALLREFAGDVESDQFGSLVADLGDVDGDGVRDFAIAAPNRTGNGNRIGAIFVVSGTGTTIRSFTPVAFSGLVGNSMSWVGDLDGDGVRDLVYNDYDFVPGTYTVRVVSGATGASIRTHTSSAFDFGFLVGRAGDVDADGIDDYLIADHKTGGHVTAYSGASGASLFSYATAATNLGTAGDVDLDGHADVVLLDHFSPKIHLVSGSTGLLLHDLGNVNGWYATSATGDLDGDGHPDVVATLWDDTIHLFSGATGNELSVWSVTPTGVADPLRSVDATADVDGDGVLDVLTGAPYVSHPTGGAYGDVFLVSGSSGSTIATVSGSAFKSQYGSSLTLVSDVDGDGWRDAAVVVPGGLDDASLNLVLIVSGQDGHELSRFQASDEIGAGDGTIVSIGDVNSDGVADVAVVVPGPFFAPTNRVELHSGADGSLLSTLVTPSGTPTEVAAAADVGGTPLLAVATASPDAVLVYDLTTNSVVTNYSGHGNLRLSCVGDVNGDGTVDWVVVDGAGNGAVNVFSGGSSPKTLWSVSGKSSNPLYHATSTGDLDGDGHDDVLAGYVADDNYVGKVTALSGVNGAKLFDVFGTQPFESLGVYLTTVGDVNRDGVCDFAIGASRFDASAGALFVYSGKTATQLYRFDDANATELGYFAVARQRWHDDPRVDPDKVPDLLVGVPDVELRGRADLYRLDDLMLQVDPPSPMAGTTVTATTRGGPPGNLVGLYALDLSGTPLDYFLALGTFNSKGNFAVTDQPPSSMKGLTLDVISYGVGFNGKLEDSQETAIEIQ